MTREEYINQSKEKQMMIRQLQCELSEMRKSYINEHKQIKEELPVKIHYIHSEKDDYTIEDEAYVVSFKVFDYKYVSEFGPLDGLVYPVLKKMKKDGSMSKFELSYPKFGTFKFWVIGKEDEVYEIDFGK